MPKIQTRVTFNRTAVAARIRAASNKALTDLGNQVLKDCNLYVPVQGGDNQNGGGGDLLQSSLTNSDREAHDMSFILRWATPYARYQYYGLVMHGTPDNRTYGPEPLHYTKSGAHKMWAHYARSQHGKEWKAVYQAALRRHAKQ